MTGVHSTKLALVAAFGAAQTSIATVGYTLKNGDGTTYQARTTSGVAETAAPGTYRVEVAAGVFTAPFDGYVVWDTGGGAPIYAVEELLLIAPPPAAADYTTARAAKLDQLDAAVSSRSSHTAADAAAAVWTAATRTLSAISDSAGVTTLLARLTAGRATNLDNADASVAAVKAKTDLIPAAGPPSVADWTPARAAHLDADISTRATPADVDVQVEADLAGLTTDVALIRAKTDLLGAARITIASPVASSGSVTVYQGDDYALADGRALVWTDTAGGWPDLTGHSVDLILDDGPEVAATVVDANTIRVELTATQTAALEARQYKYELLATLTGGRKATLARGRFLVIDALVPAP